MTLLSSIALFLVAQAGIVSGVVRDAAGTPQAGVRVAALAVLPPDEARAADVLVSIGKTDESGGYTLEIPQGRYYIVAGRVSRPIYYPNAAGAGQATIFSIGSGSKTAGVDFEVFALTGVVRDTAGKPQAGVSVSAIDVNDTSTLICRSDSESETETDSSGRYRLVVLPGEYSIAARSPGRTRFYPSSETREQSTPVSIRNGVTASGLDIEIPVETIARDRNLYVAALENALLGCPIAARMQFQTLFTTFPDSEFADAAKYQLAESYYRDGSPAAMTSAMREFAEYLRFFPNAPRTEEARQRLLEIQQKLR